MRRPTLKQGAVSRAGATIQRTARGRRVRAALRRDTATAGSRVVRVARQGSPDMDRYREIQQALAAKGYLKGEASGVWDADSDEALRRFQQDQNLKVDGKIGSLTLITLGLGPKYDDTAAVPATTQETDSRVER